MNLPHWTRELYGALWASFLIAWALIAIWEPELRAHKESITALLLIVLVLLWVYVGRG